MSDAVNFCDKCGRRLIGSVCENCSKPIAEIHNNGKSKLGIGIVVGVLITTLVILGFKALSDGSSPARKILSSVTESLDGCNGEAGCEFAKEALKSELFAIYEKDTYSILLSRCEQFVPSDLIDNPDGNEEEVFAKTNWMVSCNNVLYEEYKNKFGKTVANP
jgi:hypothetical protein